MWVHATDTDTWKLWIVPPTGLTDKQEFYRRISEVTSKNPAALGGIDASYKYPRDVRIRAELPRGPTGKVIKAQIEL